MMSETCHTACVRRQPEEAIMLLDHRMLDMLAVRLIRVIERVILKSKTKVLCIDVINKFEMRELKTSTGANKQLKHVGRRN